MSIDPVKARDALQNLQTLRYTQDDDGIGVLTLDRPPVNALGRALVDELGTAAAALARDVSVRGLIVKAKGRTFCAGADLKERDGMSAEDVRAFVRQLSRTFQQWSELPMPTVAAIHGTAAGGGCELALACDFRLIAEDGRIGLPETTLGIVPGAGGTQRLPRLIGPARAKKWIFSGNLYGAEQALADGVVDGIATAESLTETARQMIAGMAASAPLAVRAAKQAIESALGNTLEDGLKSEWRAYEKILHSDDRLEALAAFRQKRKPDFKGR